MRPTTIHFQPKSHSRSVHKFAQGGSGFFFVPSGVARRQRRITNDYVRQTSNLT